MIFFSNKYLEDQSVIHHCYLDCYFDYKDLINRINRMINELKRYNPLLDYKETVKILKKDNSETLRHFNYGDLWRFRSLE